MKHNAAVAGKWNFIVDDALAGVLESAESWDLRGGCIQFNVLTNFLNITPGHNTE